MIISLFVGLSTFVEAHECNSSESSLSRQSAEILKAANVNYAKSDMADFCHRNLLLRYINSKKKIDTKKQSTKNLMKISDNLNDEPNPWAMTLAGSEKSKKAAIDYYAKFTTREMSPHDEENLKSYINTQATNKKVLTASSPLVVNVACAKDEIIHLGSCVKTFNFIEDRFFPKGGFDVLDADLWKRVYASHKYNQGLKNVVETIASRIKNPERDKTANVFDDIQNAFHRTGMDAKDSSNAAWDIMGLIGNHGPNIGIISSDFILHAVDGEAKFTSDKMPDNAKNIGIIASSMAYLDAKKLQAGLPMYSYPSSIKATCDNAKPYHFWMSAYIARAAVIDGNASSDVAAKTTFMIEKGYQLRRNLAGDNDNPTKNISRLNDFSSLAPVNQIIRTDLAYGAAGAMYGAHSTSGEASSELDVDRAIVALEENAAAQKSQINSGNIFSNYLEWNNTFQADTALDSFEK